LAIGLFEPGVLMRFGGFALLTADRDESSPLEIESN